VLGRAEVAKEGLRRQLADLDPGRSPHGEVRGDETYLLAVPALGGQALEQRVRVRCIANLERAAVEVVAVPVEDDDATGALLGDEARQSVDELPNVAVIAGMQQVVAVEQVQRRVRHVASVPRTEGLQRRPTR
jgi:hypothetical protein